jgi:hypothetical protein
MWFCADQIAIRGSADVVLHASGGVRGASDRVLRASGGVRGSSDVVLRRSDRHPRSSDVVLHASGGVRESSDVVLRRSDRHLRILGRFSARLRPPLPARDALPPRQQHIASPADVTSTTSAFPVAKQPGAGCRRSPPSGTAGVTPQLAHVEIPTSRPITRGARARGHRWLARFPLDRGSTAASSLLVRVTLPGAGRELRPRADVCSSP